MDEKGNLYLYKAALLCKNEIIKRLINGTYQLVEASPIGKLLTSLCFMFSVFEAIIISPNIMKTVKFSLSNVMLNDIFLTRDLDSINYKTLS